MLDFRIYTFLTVCATMNFTKAAEQLHITQPAVSQHIRYLEELYQTKLFVHEGKKIRLSPAGEILLHTATTLKNDENVLFEQMHQPELDAVPLHFGVTMTIGEFYISKALGSYLKAHPSQNLKMILSNTTELLNKLREGKLHFALVEGYFESEEFDCLTFSKEDFIPVCAASHSFTKKPQQLSDLLSERLIIRESGSGTRDILEKNLDVRNLAISDFSRIAEISSMHAIIDLVKADCGITFLYKAAVQQELVNGELVELTLSDFQMQHDFTFLWNKGSIFTAQYQAIFAELRQY